MARDSMTPFPVGAKACRGSSPALAAVAAFRHGLALETLILTSLRHDLSP